MFKRKNSGEIIILLGKSASGKDSIKKCAIEEYRCKPVPLATTRPPRPGELKQKNYDFLTREEFEKRNIVCRTSFHTANGLWFYGIYSGTELEPNGKYITDINPGQYEEFMESYKNFTIIPVYIETNEEDRILHMIHREMEKENPDYKEVCRRICSDSSDFKETNPLMKKIRDQSILVFNNYQEPARELTRELMHEIAKKY